jgi:hypothetical protein
MGSPRVTLQDFGTQNPGIDSPKFFVLLDQTPTLATGTLYASRRLCLWTGTEREGQRHQRRKAYGTRLRVTPRLEYRFVSRTKQPFIYTQDAAHLSCLKRTKTTREETTTLKLSNMARWTWSLPAPGPGPSRPRDTRHDGSLPPPLPYAPSKPPRRATRRAGRGSRCGPWP